MSMHCCMNTGVDIKEGVRILHFKVVYFSRTNTSKMIAESISNKLSCDVVQITDDKNWKGIIGYIRAGFYSSTNRKVKIKIVGNLDQVDEYIVVTPLWAGGIASTTKSFLDTIPREKVHLVITSLGSHEKDRSGYKSVNDITRKERNEEVVINDLVTRLNNNSKK